MLLNVSITHIQPRIYGSPPWELELRPLGVATGNALSVTHV